MWKESYESSSEIMQRQSEAPFSLLADADRYSNLESRAKGVKRVTHFWKQDLLRI